MGDDDKLRRALHAGADAVVPAPDGLDRIRERTARTGLLGYSRCHDLIAAPAHPADHPGGFVMLPGNDDEVLDLLTDAAITARQAKDALDRTTGRA